MKTKTLHIEWKRLDKNGKTCDRCADTGTSLRDLVTRLRKCCGPRLLRVELRQIPLSGKRIAQSNAIKFNGIPIEKLLPRARSTKTHCGSCSRMVNASVSCRSLRTKGKSYDGLPLSLLWQAAMRALGCGCSLP